MKRTQILDRRFDQLVAEATSIMSAHHEEPNGMGGRSRMIDDEAFIQWKVKAINLVGTVCGETSQHFKRFLEAEKFTMYRTSYDCLRDTRAILVAAQDDYASGLLNSLRNLIEAELFNTELEQADELFAHGYFSAAAVIAGVVLETTLRKICDENTIQIGNLNYMSSECAKAGIFNKLVAKQITAWADIRNSAAHGVADGFVKADVKDMISGVGRFVSERMS